MKKNPEIKVETDAEKYMNNISLLLAGLGKHLEIIDEIDLKPLDKFTLTGLVMSISTQMSILLEKFKEWGMIEK